MLENFLEIHRIYKESGTVRWIEVMLHYKTKLSADALFKGSDFMFWIIIELTVMCICA